MIFVCNYPAQCFFVVPLLFWLFLCLTDCTVEISQNLGYLPIACLLITFIVSQIVYITHTKQALSVILSLPCDWTRREVIIALLCFCGSGVTNGMDAEIT